MCTDKPAAQELQEATLDQVLAARDRRASRQEELLREYSLPLVSFSMNIAGPVKNSPLIRRAFKLGQQMLAGRLELLGKSFIYSEQTDALTGCEGLYVVDMEPDRLKDITLSIEETSPAGRLYDMDVMTTSGVKVSRNRPRKCLICDEDAQVCGRSRTHSIEELQAATRKILTESIDRHDAGAAASLAVRALLYEVSATPKPGLVDRSNSGSHADMDIYTFMSSAASLFPYFESCVLTGRSSAGRPAADTLAELRSAGLLAESIMRSVTGGVNTHKGAIYSMGILCGALGRMETENWNQPDLIAKTVSEMAAGTVERELASQDGRDPMTAGQRIYAEHGITGIRGEVEAGFPAVLDHGLPVLEAALSIDPAQAYAMGYEYIEDLAGSAALLSMLTKTADTNMIARGGIELFEEAVCAIEDILSEHEYPSKDELDALDLYFIENNLSPGGSADLLSICWMLHFLKEEVIE